MVRERTSERAIAASEVGKVKSPRPAEATQPPLSPVLSMLECTPWGIVSEPRTSCVPGTPCGRSFLGLEELELWSRDGHNVDVTSSSYVSLAGEMPLKCSTNATMFL